MKRVHWWTLLGLSGTGLAAMLLGQTVFGQPEAKEPLPFLLPTPPVFVVQPEKKASGPTSEGPTVQRPILPKGRPTFTTLPAQGQIGTVSVPPAVEQGAPTPAPLKIEGTQPPSAGLKKPANLLPSDVPSGRQQPAVSIEWGGPASVRIHQPTPYTINVRNTSTTPVQNVIIRHRLGQGVACKTSEPKAVNEGGELVWNLGALAPDEQRRIELTLVAQARGVQNNHATVSFSAVSAHQVQVREPQLVVKMRGPEKVVIGENVTLLFVLSNPGDGVADSIKMKMLLPEGLEHPRGKVVEVEVGNLAPKEIRPMQLVCLARAGGMQKCTIVASGEGGLDSTDSTQFEVLTPKLDITMHGPKLRYLDRHAIYVLKVTNPGTAPASNVEVHELIPPGFKFHQANLGGQFQQATRLVSWNLGDLQPGQSKDVAVDLIPIEPGEHRLIAHAKAARGLKSQADARTMVEGLPSLSIEVGHIDDPLEVGAETAYEIRLANTGTKTETNIEVVCTLPEQLEFKGAKCSTTLRYRLEGRDLIFESLARLAPKADVIYRVQVRGVAPGDIRFRTRIKADGLKEPVLREENTRIYSDEDPVRPAPSVPVVTPKPAPMPTEAAPSPLPTVPAPIVPTPNLPTPLPVAPTPTLPSLPTPLPVAPTLPLPVVPTALPVAPTLPMLPAPSIPLPTTSIPAPLPLLPSLPSDSSPLPVPAPSDLPLPAPSNP